MILAPRDSESERAPLDSSTYNVCKGAKLDDLVLALALDGRRRRGGHLFAHPGLGLLPLASMLVVADRRARLLGRLFQLGDLVDLRRAVSSGGANDARISHQLRHDLVATRRVFQDKRMLRSSAM